MVHFFLSIYDVLVHHRRLVAAALLLCVAGFVTLALHVNYEEDIAKFLPRNEQNERYQQVYQQIAMQNRIAVLFAVADSTQKVNTERMTEAMEAFGERMAERNAEVHVQVSSDEDQILDMVAFVNANVPYFLTDADYQRIDSMLSQPDFIRQQIEEDKAMLLLPTGGMMTRTLPYDPLHLFGAVTSRMSSLRMDSPLDMIDGYLFTADGQRSIVTLEAPYGASETHRNALLAATIDSVMAETETLYPDLRISAIGAPLVAVSNADRIKTDSLIAVTVAVVLILLILWLHYRRLSDMLWIGVSIAFGWLFALAGMALMKESVSIIVLGIGSIIIGIAVNYPLHFLDHLRETPSRREALKEMVPPLLIGNITTVAAFLCLVWLDAQALRDLGLFGSLMLVGTILFVLIALPVLKRQEARGKRQEARSSLPHSSTPPLPKSKFKIQSSKFKVQSSKFKVQSSKFKVYITLLLTLVLGYFSLQTSFDSDLTHINYMTEQQKEDMAVLTSLTHEAPLYAVAEGESLEEALQANDSLLTQLHTWSDSIVVKGVADIVPSTAAQQRAITRWTQFWSQGRGEQLAANVRREALSQGFTQEAFQPFYDLFTTKHEVQQADYFEPIVNPLTGTYILSGHSHYQIVNFVYGPLTQQPTDSRHTFTFTREDLSNQLVRVLNDSFNYVGWVCGIVVFFFLWISFGKIELALLSFLPLAAGWIWILGLMQLFGVQFNIVNIILASFIFGQGDDYTIFITEGLIYEYTTGRQRLASYKRSIAISALLMFTGIGCLILAKHPALRSLAVVTIIGMLTVVFMAYYLPPLVFRWLTTKHGEKRQVPITLKRIAYSLGAITFFLAVIYLFMKPFTWLYFHIGKTTERKRLRYHQLIQRMAHFSIHHVPGVSFTFNNATGETFDRPSVIVCNHQSHLDLVCLLMMTPKMVFLTNDWVWHNPFYGSIIRRAEFYPVSDGIEHNLPLLRDLYQRGYSICVFPEGTRSADCRILRFHKGAFYLARKLGADILPVVLHGAGHVLPKEDFMLREGSIYAEVCERIAATDGATAEQHDSESASMADRDMTRHMRHFYQQRYAQLCEQLETAEYLKPMKKYEEYYKMED